MTAPADILAHRGDAALDDGQVGTARELYAQAAAATLAEVDAAASDRTRALLLRNVVMLLRKAGRFPEADAAVAAALAGEP